MRYIYLHSCLIPAHEVFGIYGLCVAFEGHIYCWHICGYSMENKSSSLVHFCLWICMCSNVESICRLHYLVT